MTDSISTLRLLAKCGSMDLSALGPIADQFEQLQQVLRSTLTAYEALAGDRSLSTDSPDPVVLEAEAALSGAAAEPNGDHGVPTDGQLMDQLEAAFERMNDGYVEMDLGLRRSLAENLVRFNRPKMNAVDPTHQHGIGCAKLAGGECNCNPTPLKSSARPCAGCKAIQLPDGIIEHEDNCPVFWAMPTKEAQKSDECTCNLANEPGVTTHAKYCPARTNLQPGEK